MANWYEDVFLDSLFREAGANRQKWLTRKQTAICTDHMEQHTTYYNEYPGDNRKGLYYTSEWRGRKIILQYSKKNGCGIIRFGATEEETRKAKEARSTADRIRRKQILRRHLDHRPEKFMEWYERDRNDLACYQAELSEENNPEYIAILQERIKETLEKITLMEEVLAAE